MNARRLKTLAVVIGAATIAPWAATVDSAPPSPPWFTWSTVVNNNDLMPPGNKKNFNSYNQPSVNLDGLVVIRARSRGGPGDTGGPGNEGGSGGGTGGGSAGGGMGGMDF